MYSPIVSTDSGPAPILMRIPSAVALAVVSAGAYFVAHRYEAAYLKHFGLPASLVRVGLNTVIVAAGSMLSAARIALLFWSFERDEQRERDDFADSARMLLSLFGMIFVVNLWLYRLRWREWALWFVLVFVTNVVVNILRWRTKRRERAGLPLRALRDGRLRRALAPWIGGEALTLIMILFTGALLATSAGRAEAINQEEFLTVSQPADMVVIRAYDDVLIAAYLDRQHHEVGPDFALFSRTAAQLAHLRQERLGPLSAVLVSHPTPAPSSPATAPGTGPGKHHGAPAVRTTPPPAPAPAPKAP